MVIVFALRILQSEVIDDIHPQVFCVHFTVPLLPHFVF